MLYRKIDITGREPISIEIPESWDDVTYSQFIGISNEEDQLKRLSILTKIPDDLFIKYPELADFYVWVESSLQWSNKWDEKENLYESFLIDNDTFHFPKDIGVLSIGLYKDLQKEIQDNKDNILNIYPLICASYYQLIKDGEYDYNKAANYVSVFNKQPCKKVYNSAGFFLNKLSELRSGTLNEQKKGVIPTIKRWLALIGFLRYLGLKLY